MPQVEGVRAAVPVRGGDLGRQVGVVVDRRIVLILIEPRPQPAEDVVGPQRRTLLGVLLILPTFGVLAVAYDPRQLASVLNASFAIAWLALWMLAIRAAVPAKGAPA